MYKLTNNAVSVKEEPGTASENEKIVPFMKTATTVVKALEGDHQRSSVSGCHKMGD